MTTLLIAGLLLSFSPAGAMPRGTASLSLEHGRYATRGEPNAPVIIVEFSDFKCHACEKFNLTIMPNLEKEFISSGLVKVAFVDFPLTDHESYTTVAESVHCAGEQGKYWQMHDALWRNIGALSDQSLVDYAAELGLNVSDFRSCLATDRFRRRVLDDLRFSYDLGLTGRPTFFIGRRSAGQGEDTYRGRFIKGAQSYLVYKAVIQRMLSRPEAP
ncbi:MAG: DsbA family protein [Acidobacteriota bacterium]